MLQPGCRNEPRAWTKSKDAGNVPCKTSRSPTWCKPPSRSWPSRSFFGLPDILLCLASDAFGFRSRSTAEKVLFSVVYSIASTPVLAVLLIRFTSYRFTLVVFLWLAVVSLSLFLKQLMRSGGFFTGLRRSTWILLGMTLAWFLVVQMSLADLQIGHRLYVSFAAFDYSVRVPLVEAVARNGVPPLNSPICMGPQERRGCLSGHATKRES